MASILLGTDDGIHLIGDGGGTSLAGRPVGALARGPDALWAVVDGSEVWRDEAALGEATLVAASLGLRLNCLACAGDRLLAGTAEAHLLRLEEGMLRRVESFDRAEGRDGWYTPWGGPPDVRSLAVGADGVPYANVHVGGILRGDDDGGTWTPTIDVHADVHQVLAHPQAPGRLLAATAQGLAASADAGRSWRFLTEGLHASYCRAVAAAGDTVLVTCSEGPRGGRAAVYRRPLDAGAGAPFERCQAGLPEWFQGNIDTACLDAAGATAAFATAGGEVWLSGDAGASWRLLADGLPPVRCLLLG
jgi:hypothetical protein